MSIRIAQALALKVDLYAPSQVPVLESWGRHWIPMFNQLP